MKCLVLAAVLASGCGEGGKMEAPLLGGKANDSDPRMAPMPDAAPVLPGTGAADATPAFQDAGLDASLAQVDTGAPLLDATADVRTADATTPAAFQLTPASYEWPAIKAGSSDEALFTLQNVGGTKSYAVELAVWPAENSRMNSEEFKVTDYGTCAGSLSPGASCRFKVGFQSPMVKPTVMTRYTAVISVVARGPDVVTNATGAIAGTIAP
jgi:hypothetical protein